MSMSSRAEIFWDLRRFLRTENVEIEGLSKTEVQNWYINEYKTYRHQISPDEKLPTFFLIMQAVYKLKLAHYEEEKLVLGPSADLARKDRDKSPRHKQKKANVKQPRPTSLGGQKMKQSPKVSPQSDQKENPREHENNSAVFNGLKMPRKYTMARNKMAVDQHLTFKRGLARVVDDPDFKGNNEDWKYIGRTERGFYCTLCQSKLTSQPDTQRHLEGRRHRLAVSMTLIRSKKEKLVEGCPSIVLTCDTEETEGTYFIHTDEEEVKRTEITVTNVGDSEVELVHCEMMKKVRVFTLRDSKKVTDGMGTVTLKPGDTYKIQVRVQAQHVGNYHCPVMFQFVRRSKTSKQNQYILRYLHCKCKNNLIDELKPTTKYKRPPRVNKAKGRVSEIVPGLKLQSMSGDNLERDIGLPQCMVPQSVRKMINRGLTDTHGLSAEEISDMSQLRCVLEANLNLEQYLRRFESLLFFEEVQMEVDIRKYDMENVPLRVYNSNQRLLLLEVPGLSENRPSVLRGDWLFVSYCDTEGHGEKKEYQGYVHEVLLNEVALGFDKSFRDNFIMNQKVNVRFVFNRLPIRLQHRACQLAWELTLKDILFPNKDKIPREVKLPELKLYNKDLENNKQQKCAVQHILAGTSRPAPYVVFGPPGTGKTVTIVEAIKQIWKCSSSSHVLACTPSNSAADLIAKRLLQHIPKAEIIRLNAASRSWSAIPEEIKCVCNFNKETRYFYYPRKEDLQKYRIIITTLVTAGRLVSANFQPDHFSHVFIDEAGHAQEPEALIALAGIMEVNTALQSKGQVVIAGDPKQLGPILRSPLAIKYGLDISLLERYMETCDLYSPTEEEGGHRVYDTRVITKLLKNYRSHPAILKLPNEMFYDNELIPCAGIDRERLCSWEGLQKRGFPLVFHGVVGEDLREEKSPSFFNPQEVSVVIQYVEDLFNCKKGGINLKQSDIGVISPYRKQRFNVTVTRAKALLIVIGNPNTLSGDMFWKQLIDYCEVNGAYRGTERMSEDDELEDLIQRLAAVELIDDECRLIPEIQSDYNEQAWRSDL